MRMTGFRMLMKFAAHRIAEDVRPQKRHSLHDFRRLPASTSSQESLSDGCCDWRITGNGDILGSAGWSGTDE